MWTHAVTGRTAHTSRAEPRRVNQGFDLLADQLLGTMGAIRRSGRRHAGRPEELLQLTGPSLSWCGSCAAAPASR